MNVQNLRDDIYAHRERIIHNSGYVLLPLGAVSMVAVMLINPWPVAVCALFIFSLLAISFGFVFVCHPHLMNAEIDYRYSVKIETKTQDLWMFLKSSGMVWSSKAYPNPIRHSWPTINTRIYVTRLEDQILLQMKF